MAFLGMACFEDSPTDADDTTPPAAVGNLQAFDATETTITLSWTAPGDDGDEGSASSYDIRYTTDDFSRVDWASAAQVSGEPQPGPAGTQEQMVVTGLNSVTQYFFALKTGDDVINWSAISNTAVDTTLGPGLVACVANVGKYAIVNPMSGVDSVWVTTGLPDLDEASLGYQGRHVLLRGLENLSDGNQAVYRCDTFSADNLVKLTDDDDYKVMTMDGSPVASIVVCEARQMISPQAHNIYRFNEDGTGWTQLSQYEEGLSLPNGTACKILYAGNPSWSQDGTKIAFTAFVRELAELHAHDLIVVMNPDGSDKTAIYEQPVEDADYRDLSWTYDGRFIFFIQHRDAIAVCVDDGNVSDLTSALNVDDDEVYNICVSPWQPMLIVNHWVVNPDLYRADFTMTTNSVSISGIPTRITDQAEVTHNYRQPDWAPFVPEY